MDVGFSRLLLAGFATLVLLCQDLALGFCHQSHTIFLETCPCTEEADPCQCPEDCATFFALELDNFAKSETVGIAAKIEVSVPLDGVEFTRTGAGFLGEQVLSSRDVPQSPSALHGRTMLCRYGVARI